ncbi:MAG: patatin-like phospholipase family protein, partial [Eubacteriales bacterium]|nr:patatin-like phospholipase family protein [Eubacteriales bacterium]
IIRTKRSFVDLALVTSLPFDWQTFSANPAQLRIGAYKRDVGKMVYYTKNDMQSMQELMKIVRSSSSLPIFMPPTYYRGDYYIDGGVNGGIALDVAQKDGFKKFFVVLSQEKGYRKSPVRSKSFIKAYYRKYPYAVEAMLRRHIVYNETLEKLEELERQGKAFLVYPDEMPVSNKELNYVRLSESYLMGYQQGKRDFPKWKEFLGLG